MKLSCISVLALIGLVSVGCGGAKSASFPADSSGGSAGSPNAPGAPTSSKVSYYKLDENSACASGITKRLDYDKTSNTGVLEILDCAGQTPSASSVPSSDIQFHSRFDDFLVLAGEVYVSSDEFARTGQLETPRIYCKESATETGIGYLRISLEFTDARDQCRTDRAYVSPIDGYHFSGTGGSSCDSMNLLSSSDQISFVDDRYSVLIDLTAGSREEGFPAQVELRVKDYDNGTEHLYNYALTCFVDPAF